MVYKVIRIKKKERFRTNSREVKCHDELPKTKYFYVPFRLSFFLLIIMIGATAYTLFQLNLITFHSS